ncbi:hypothetical protein SAMN04488074_106229 [Lentzea albidocapillata subsp. violacea]|uniref:Small secreted domain n=1 Tax=Lentzea albidocapillata subsp. violacea TaxID=128104 RepID=A0A1G9DE25_9PSEU|nr:hypothetical protein [Lentzea albidocapillata]SDK62090.1 hypothetical protein SAMN04488074_106229 [Lentzea albidocapillata subsp. violacea]
MGIKKIVASVGIAAGAIAAMAGTASAAPQLPDVDPIGQISELGDSAGVSTLHDFSGNVDMNHNGTKVIGG